MDDIVAYFSTLKSKYPEYKELLDKAILAMQQEKSLESCMDELTEMGGKLGDEDRATFLSYLDQLMYMEMTTYYDEGGEY